MKIEKLYDYTIIMLDGEKHHYLDDQENANEMFLELLALDKDSIGQFYVKEWIKTELSSEECINGDGKWEEGGVEVYYDKDKNNEIRLTPALLNFDEDMNIILEDYPYFHISGSIHGMRELYYGDDSYLVRAGDYIYNVDKEIYQGYIEQGSWIETDYNQLSKQIGKNLFAMINVIKPVFIREVDYEYVLIYHLVNLTEYTEDELNSYIVGYYESLEEIKNIYPDSWRLIVAEIISESLNGYNSQISLKDQDEVNEYLRAKNINLSLCLD